MKKDKENKPAAPIAPEMPAGPKLKSFKVHACDDEDKRAAGVAFASHCEIVKAANKAAAIAKVKGAFRAGLVPDGYSLKK